MEPGDIITSECQHLYATLEVSRWRGLLAALPMLLLVIAMAVLWAGPRNSCSCTQKTHAISASAADLAKP